MPAAGSPADGQSASGRASKQEAGRAAGDQIKQDGGFCSLVLVRCVIFLFHSGALDGLQLAGIPPPPYPPLPPGARAPGSGSHTPVRKFL